MGGWRGVERWVVRHVPRHWKEGGGDLGREGEWRATRYQDGHVRYEQGLPQLLGAGEGVEGFACRLQHQQVLRLQMLEQRDDQLVG